MKLNNMLRLLLLWFDIIYYIVMFAFWKYVSALLALISNLSILVLSQYLYIKMRLRNNLEQDSVIK